MVEGLGYSCFSGVCLNSRHKNVAFVCSFSTHAELCPRRVFHGPLVGLRILSGCGAQGSITWQNQY